MRKLLFIPIILFLFSACWVESVSFIDGNTPEEWKQFSLKTLENNAPNAPLSYAAQLSEKVKDQIQNNTRLLLSSSTKDTQIDIEGKINSYTITPVAIQQGDAAAQNRLTISATFTLFIKEPKEEQRLVSTSRFVDYNSGLDLATVEATLLEEINAQIAQDVINKLTSNW